MSDYPSGASLLDIAVLEVASHDTPITEEVLRTDGTEANSFVQASRAVGEELVYQLSRAARDRMIGTARGSALDELAFDWFGLRRLAAAQSVCTLTFTHTNTSLIGTLPVGFQAQTGDGVVFQTTQAVTFTAGDTQQSATVIAAQAGSSGNVKAATITVIVTPASWDSAITVTNATPAAGGTDREVDEAFRARIRGFWAVATRGTLNAIKYGAASTDGVSTLSIVETDLYALSTDTVPAGRRVNLVVADSAGASNAQFISRVVTELDDWRAAGCYVEVSGGATYYQVIRLTCAFLTGKDTNAAVARIQRSVANYINGLRVGEPLRRGAIMEVVRRDVAVASLPAPEVQTPAGDVIATATQVIRTDAGSVFVN